MKRELPLITVGLHVFNEENQIKYVLDSIFSQNYPRKKMEVIVVDDNSTDNTLKIVKKYHVKIYMSGARNPEVSAYEILKHAHGEFITLLGADMRFRDKNWLKRMIRPLLENPDIVQATTRYYRHPKESVISQYLSLHPLQLDPIYRFLTTPIEKTITEKRNGYFITRYSEGKIPPQNPGMFRTKISKKIHKGSNKWLDLDQLCLLVENGYTKFAYVPEAGYYHFHVDSLKHLIQKRLRNLNQIYLPNVQNRRFKWFDLIKPFEWVKLLYWVIIANLFIPLLILSIFKTIKNKTWLHLLDAPIALILTDVLLIGFLINPQGRSLILNNFLAIIKNER